MKILSTIESRQLKKGELQEININGVVYDLTSYIKGMDTFEAVAKNVLSVPVVVPSKDVIALRDTEIEKLNDAIKNEVNYIIISRNGIDYKVCYDENNNLVAVNTKIKELFVVR